MSLKRKLVSAFLAAGLASGSGKAARADRSAEIAPGPEDAVVRVETIGEISGVGIYSLTDVSAGYSEEVSLVKEIADLSCAVSEDLSVVAEGQLIPGLGIIPRAGASYFGEIDSGMGSLAVYALGTIGLTNPDLELVTQADYALPLTEDLSLEAGLDTVTTVGLDGFHYGEQIFRLGMDISGISVGGRYDLVEVDGEVIETARGYLGADF